MGEAIKAGLKNKDRYRNGILSCVLIMLNIVHVCEKAPRQDSRIEDFEYLWTNKNKPLPSRKSVDPIPS